MNKKIKLPQVINQPYQLTKNFIKYQFSAGENRVIVRILQRIKVHQEVNYNPQIDFDGNVSLQFHYRDLLLVSDNAKGRLDSTLQSLREKTLVLESNMIVNGKKEASTRLIGVIQKPEWTKSRSHVQVNLDADFYKFLTDLSQGFTTFIADSSFNLTGSYNIKFYYYVRQWIDTGGRKVSLEQFRRELEIPDHKYINNTASSFRQKIIDPAKKMLDEICDVSFNYSVVKNGRKVTHFSFKFFKTNNKTPKRHNIEKVEEIFDLLEGNFTLNNADRSRIIGIMNKYQFSFLKSVINTHYFDIKSCYDKYGDLPNSVNKVILDNYEHLFKKKN